MGWPVIVADRYEVMPLADGEWYCLHTQASARQAHYARLSMEAAGVCVRAIECRSGEETVNWVSRGADGALRCTCQGGVKGFRRTAWCYHRALAVAGGMVGENPDAMVGVSPVNPEGVAA